MQFSRQIRTLLIEKGSTALLGIREMLQKLYHQDGWKTKPVLPIAQSEVAINITPELKETFDSVNQAPSNTCELELKQPIPGKRIDFMTEALFISGLCSNDWVLSVSEETAETQDKRHHGVWIGNLLPCAPQNVHLLDTDFGNLHGFSYIPTHFIRNNKNGNRSYSKQISQAILPDESYSTSTVECMWLSVAIYLQNRTNWRISQDSSWVSLQTRTQSHGKDTSLKPVRLPDNTHWGDNIFLGRRWWKTILLHSSRQWEWASRTYAPTKGWISTRCERLGSTWGNILIEDQW